MSNHLHQIVEADDSKALSRGMQGLCVRMAQALNAALNRRGRVFADHFHSRPLRSPTELVNAIRYVLRNAERHASRVAQIRTALKRSCCGRLFAVSRPWC